MAKKKATKKRTAKKNSVAKPSVAKKSGIRKVGKKPSKRKVSTKTASHTKRRRKTEKLRRTLKPTERLEKMTISIERGAAGDLIVTESGGGSIQVHHTVHRGEPVTPIPGKSYDDLKALGTGSHEIDVIKTLEQ